jgi:hypothetical protein
VTISKRQFLRRWPSPPAQRAVDGGALRAFAEIWAAEAATTVTLAGILAAFGAALSAVGLVEYSVTHEPRPSPFDNSWLIAGLVILGVSLAMAGTSLVGLVVSRVRAELWKAHLSQLNRRGELLYEQFMSRSPGPSDTEISEWYEEVRENLAAFDRTGALLVRFETPGRPYGDGHWLLDRTARLSDFLAQLP